MGASAEDGRERVVWGVVGLAATIGAAMLVYSFVGAIVTGLFLYYATRPIDRWLDERVDHPDLNAGATLLLVGLPMLVVLGYAVFLGYGELVALVRSDRLASVRALVEPYVNVSALTSSDRLLAMLRNHASTVVQSLARIGLWLVRLFLIVTIAFYLLRDDRKIARWVEETATGEYGVVEFFRAVDDDLTTIFTGNLITVAITAVIAVLVFYAYNAAVPAAGAVVAPVLLGLLVGIFTLVPVLGIKLVYVPYGAYLLAASLLGSAPPLWVPIAFFAVVFVVVDAIPDIFIRTYISKGSLNMGLVLLSYVLGTNAFGWYGLFLGPVVLVLFLHFARRILPGLVYGRSRSASD